MKYSKEEISPKILFRLVIGGDFSSIKAHGFVARPGLKPIPLTIPMGWTSEDSNVEFNLHAWRFLNASWAHYISHTNDEIAKEVFLFNLEFIKDWIRFLGESKSKYAWYDMSVGIRAIHIAFMKYLIEEHSLESSDEDFGVIDQLAFKHIGWLSDQKNITKGNHALYEVIGLAVLSWQYKLNSNNIYIQKNMTSLMDVAFDDYFVSTENSPFYHKYNVDLFNKVPSFLFPGIKDRIDHMLRSAPLVTKWLTAPDGYFYRIGDTEGRGVLLLPEDVIAENFLNNKICAYKDFGKSGYQIIRSHPSLKKEESFSLIFRGRPASYMHSHCDVNSFIFYQNGVEIFSDPGKFTYEYGEWRNWFISDASHNTAGLYKFPFYPKDVNLSSIKILPIKEEDGCFFLSGEVRKSDDFFHSRKITFSPNKILVVSDRIENIGKYKTEIRYILGKDFKYFYDGHQGYIKKEGGCCYKISFDGDIENIKFFNHEDSKAWVSEVYGKKYVTGMIVIHCHVGVSNVKMQLSLV